MVKGILLLVLVFLLNSSLAQGNEQQLDSLLESSFGLRSVNRDSSLMLAKKAFDLARHVEDKKRSAAAQVMIGSYYRTVRKDTAIVILQDALSILDGEDNYKFAGLAHWYLGKIFISLLALDKATQYYNKAHANFKAINDPYLEAAVISDLAILEGKRFNYVKALDFTQRAYQIKQENNLPADSELNNMAIIYSAMKDFASARNILWKLLHNQNVGDTASMSYTYNALGGTYSNENRLDSAIHYYKLAQQHANWNQNSESELIALANWAGVLNRMERKSEANALLRKANTLRSNQNPYLNQMIEMEVSRLFFLSGQPDSAIHHGKLGLAIAIQSGSKRYASELAQIISDAFVKKRKTDSAFFYYRIYSQYKDSLTVDELNTRYNDLRIQLRNSEAEKEITLLKKQQELDRLDFQFWIFFSISCIMAGVVLVLFFWYRVKLKQKHTEMEKEVLQSQLALRERDLSNLTLQMIHRQNSAMEIEDEIKKIIEVEKNSKFNRVVSLIGVTKSLDKEWETFNTYFNTIHQNFYKELDARNFNLTIIEQRLCVLIKMKLPNREIASLLNIEVNSVKMSKYRLKKKLGLSEEDDLNTFIAQI